LKSSIPLPLLKPAALDFVYHLTASEEVVGVFIEPTVPFPSSGICHYSACEENDVIRKFKCQTSHISDGCTKHVLVQLLKRLTKFPSATP